MDKQDQINYLITDPKPDVKGLLLSDMIEYYVKEIGLIKQDEFSPTCLEPAAYQLRLGSLYYLDGTKGELQEKGEKSSLELPRNSLTYVTAFEKIKLPFYIAARFNLKVTIIYQGVLLGTGPQVDPGFEGRLSCPLYNFSNNPITLHFKKPFAIIDFVKTTSLSDVARENLKREIS